MSNSSGSAETQLRHGQDLLATASDNPSQLGAALLALHGAFEKRLRALLAARLPSMSSDILDVNKTRWLELANLAEAHLGLSKTDRDLILTANTHRNNFAHDVTFTWSRQGVSSYETLILRLWDGSTRAGSAYQPYGGSSTPRGSSTYSPGGSRSGTASTSSSASSYAPPPPPPPPRSSQAYSAGPKTAASTVHPPPYTGYSTARSAPPKRAGERPWYRSTLMYWLLFLFALPLWAILILTDRRQGGLLKGLALLFGLFYLVACYYLAVLYLMVFQSDLSSAAADPTPIILATPASLPGGAPDASQPGPAPQPDGGESGSESGGGCQVVWDEHPGDLANKNRAMVWNEVVSQQMQGSGMTPGEFYQAVVEHNPALAADGYEFKRGKTYLLPACQ